MKLIFHIGDHKTGTTSIQTALAEGLIKLETDTIQYTSDFSHNGFANSIRTVINNGSDNVDSNAGVKRRLTRLTKTIERSNSKYSVVSAENFEGMRPDDFRVMLERYFQKICDDFQIVCYLRPHASRLVATFSELTKIGRFSGTLDKFYSRVMSRETLNYHSRISAWQNTFGERFTLRPFVRSELIHGSVVRDFAQTAFGETISLEDESAGRNVSLSLEDLMRVKVIQKRLGKTSNQHAAGFVLQDLFNNVPNQGKRTKLIVHRELAARIVHDLMEDAKVVDQSFFPGTNHFESEIHSTLRNACAYPQSTKPRDYLSRNEIRTLAVFADFLQSVQGDTDGSAFEQRLCGKRNEPVEASNLRKTLLSLTGR